ncbi:MAG: hypothetical protein Q8Q95_02890 [bacterium]|nr:hypothetical protein [bacterium]
MAKIKNFFIEKIKPHSDQVFLITVIVLVGVISFGLGRLSAKYKTAELNIKSTIVNTADLNKIVTDDSVKNKTTVKKESAPSAVEESEPNVAAIILPAQKIVGNRDSKIYHYENCAGALRMKAENKIYFASIVEAKSSGFRPAGNCQGLE